MPGSARRPAGRANERNVAILAVGAAILAMLVRRSDVRDQDGRSTGFRAWTGRRWSARQAAFGHHGQIGGSMCIVVPRMLAQGVRKWWRSVNRGWKRWNAAKR